MIHPLAPPLSPGAATLPESLLEALPKGLRNLRATRYVGDDVCASLGELAIADQAIIRHIYDFLIGFLGVLAPHPVADDKWPKVIDFARRPEVQSLAGEVRQLGDATRLERAVKGDTAKAIHDIRGGGLAAVLGRLEMMAAASDVARCIPGELTRLFILTRDQLKISRNAVVGLDDEKRDEDRIGKMHHISSIIDKWRGAIPGAATRHLPVVVASRYSGNVSECCLESAALDRILHNLIGNACRHCAGDHVALDIEPIAGAGGPNLRFVVSNALSAGDALRLGKLTGGNLGELFRPGVSTTGSGLGLSIVADFVFETFGLTSKEDLFRQKYVGAAVEGETFFVWFHWPAAKDAF